MCLYYFTKDIRFEHQWYKEGYRSVLTPYRIPEGSSVKSEFMSLCSSIHELILSGVVREDAVKFISDSENPAILFKFSWVEMAALLRCYCDKTAYIDTSKPGQAQDRLFWSHTWRLTNLLADTQKTNEIRMGQEAMKLIDGQFQKLVSFDLPINPSTLIGQEAILGSLLSKYQGLVFGEVHQDQAPKQFLMNHASFLKKKGVELIFLEHFCHSMQPSLDLLLETGIMPKALEAYVDELDHNLMHSDYNFKISPQKASYDFKELLFSMSRNKIRMVAIETTHSTVVECGVYTNSSKRMAVLNHLFKLKYDETILDDRTKWITLVGSAHMTTHFEVAGLSEIVGVPSILISQNKNQKVELNLDPTDEDGQRAHVAFWLDVAQNEKQIEPLHTPKPPSPKTKGTDSKLSTLSVPVVIGAFLVFCIGLSVFISTPLLYSLLISGCFFSCAGIIYILKYPEKEIDTSNKHEKQNDIELDATVELEQRATVILDEKPLFFSGALKNGCESLFNASSSRKTKETESLSYKKKKM